MKFLKEATYIRNVIAKLLKFVQITMQSNSGSRKATYTGLLTIFVSFTPSKYKNGPIKTLLNRCYKINNTWRGFDNDLENLTKILN